MKVELAVATWIMQLAWTADSGSRLKGSHWSDVFAKLR